MALFARLTRFTTRLSALLAVSATLVGAPAQAVDLNGPVYNFRTAHIIPAAAQDGIFDRSGPWGASSSRFAYDLSKAIFEEVNRVRARNGLAPVSPNGTLSRTASAYAAEMVAGDFFGHYAPDGRGLEARLRENNALVFDEVAENLWNAEGAVRWDIGDNVRRAVQDWMNSKQGHREALLDKNLQLAGVGAAMRERRIAVAMLFGRR